MEELASAQQKDEELKTLLDRNISLVLRKFILSGTSSLLYSGCITDTIRPFVPKVFRRRIFEAVHNLAHPNGKASSKQIGQKFVWPSMDKEIRNWSQSCLLCQTTKIHRHNKWPEAIPLSNISADTVASAVYDNWIARYGASRTITSDQDPQFEAALFKAFTNMVGCNRTRTAAYHPASNGLVERWHRTLKSALICHGGQKWVEYLPTVLLGLRTLFKASAAELLYGTTLRVPGEFFDSEDPPIDPEIFIEKLRLHMHQLRAQPTAHHIKPRLFQYKDLQSCSYVFIREDAVKKPLQAPYNGPYKVIERFSDYLFAIDINVRVANIFTERLKPAYMVNLEETSHPSSSLRASPQEASTLKTYPLSLYIHDTSGSKTIYPLPNQKLAKNELEAFV
ncbi:uncharacterized protein LOC118645593 [Monomorium pharaonis]|uniref:uncharacterized protein LOC118645593 n=1 Tax=Monomorium pharaonis TaxID=307658 RepID=UPI0017478974|nr:uncharacterized protein LOC118645593 [Monomorium pharaonis]